MDDIVVPKLLWPALVENVVPKLFSDKKFVTKNCP